MGKQEDQWIILCQQFDLPLEKNIQTLYEIIIIFINMVHWYSDSCLTVFFSSRNNWLHLETRLLHVEILPSFLPTNLSKTSK